MSCRCFLPGPILNRIGPEQSKDNWNLIICQLRQKQIYSKSGSESILKLLNQRPNYFSQEIQKDRYAKFCLEKYFEHCGQKINFLRNNFFLSWGIFSWSRYRLFSKHLWQRMFGPLRYFFDWSHIRCCQDETNLVLNEIKKQHQIIRNRFHLWSRQNRVSKTDREGGNVIFVFVHVGTKKRRER